MSKSMSPIPIDPATSEEGVGYSSAAPYHEWIGFSRNISDMGYRWAHWTLLF